MGRPLSAARTLQRPGHCGATPDTYLDTPQLDSYREYLEDYPLRQKIRDRQYGYHDRFDGDCWDWGQFAVAAIGLACVMVVLSGLACDLPLACPSCSGLGITQKGSIEMWVPVGLGSCRRTARDPYGTSLFRLHPHLSEVVLACCEPGLRVLENKRSEQ
jgi:hypothetical protein